MAQQQMGFCRRMLCTIIACVFGAGLGISCSNAHRMNPVNPPGTTAPLPVKEKKLALHPALEPYRSVIESSVKPHVRITAAVRAAQPWESKFGGNPYLPLRTAYPLDGNIKPMKLLAQINFEEVPDIGLFPAAGILCFFISVHDETYGSNFKSPTDQTNFRIIFFEKAEKDPAKLVRDFSFVSEDPKYEFPIEKELKLSFKIESEPVSFADFQFARYFLKDSSDFFKQFGKKEDEVFDFYADRFSGGGQKLGGYAFFTQWDPREKELQDYDILLLQIDSDSKLGTNWGDAGVANFFIKRKDLEKRIFSRVMYTWDCY
jgi:uncharacterized protein YwqG